MSKNDWIAESGPTKIDDFNFILETIALRDADFGLPYFGVFLMDSAPDSNFFFHRLTVSQDTHESP